MFQLKQNSSVKAFVALVNVADRLTPVTGKTGADATVTFARADGTTANYAGTATLTELTANAWSGQGVYQLTIPTAVSAVLGPLGWVVSVSGAEAARGFCDVVENVVSDVHTRVGSPSSGSTSADIAAVKAVVDAVKAKTDNLPVDPADASDVAAAITSATSPLATAANLSTLNTTATAIKAKTDNLPASPANETTVSAVKAKTDNLPTDPADASDIAAAFTALTSFLSDVPGGIQDCLESLGLQLAALTHRSKIYTATDPEVDGSAANREILFAEDGETPLYAWDLFDENGDPTAGPNVMERVPVALPGGG